MSLTVGWKKGEKREKAPQTMEQKVGALLGYLEREMRRARDGERNDLPAIRELCAEACAKIPGTGEIGGNALCNWILRRTPLHAYSNANAGGLRKRGDDIASAFPGAYNASRAKKDDAADRARVERISAYRED